MFKKTIKINRNIIVIVLFFLITIIYTYPLINNFTTYLAGNEGDGWQNVWNIWWMQESLIDNFQNPYFTNKLHYPQGITLALHTLSPLNTIIGAILSTFVNYITAYNILFVLSFIASGYGMYLLAYYISKNRIASFLAGFIYAFSPYHMGHGLGHLNLISLQWMPLFFLYFLKMLNKFNKKNIILVSLFFIFNVLSSFYYAAFLLLICGLYLFYFFVKEKDLLRIKKLLPASLIVIILISPFFIYIASQLSISTFITTNDPEEWSADLLSYFIPSRIQTIGNYFTGITNKFTGNYAETNYYLGYILIIIAIYGFWKLRKRIFVQFLGLASVIFFILSLGMHLNVIGIRTLIPFPYLLLYKFIPGFSYTGVPGRFTVMIIFCLCILFALGLKEFQKRIKNKKLKQFLFVVISLILFIEYFPAPFYISRFRVPEFYREISKENDDYAIMDLHKNPSQVLYYQTIHNKNIIGGYISRSTVNAEKFLVETPGIVEFYSEDINNNQNINLIISKYQRKYKYWKIKYLIIESDDKKAFIFENNIKDNIIFKDDLITVYKLY